MEEVVEENLHLDNEFSVWFWFCELNLETNFHNYINSYLIKEIELCGEGEDLPDVKKTDVAETCKGVNYAYNMPATSEPAKESQADTEENSVDLGDLMAKLKNLWSIDGFKYLN